MSQDELQTTLMRLHQELAQTQKLDEQSIQSLQILAKDIQSLLARTSTLDESQVDSEDSQSELAADSSLSARIREAIDQFEARHPQLTNTLSTIAERLSDMGI